MKYINHYNLGVFEVKHRDKVLVTSLNSPDFEAFSESLPFKDFEVGYIPAGYEHRPDLISDLFYNTVTYDWLIMLFNNIYDPFQQLNVGDRILIPKV